MKKTLCVAMALSTTLTQPAFAQSPCQDFTAHVTSQVMEIFRDQDKKEMQKRTELALLFQQSVDTDWIGKFVLGRFWKDSSPAQQEEYLKLYRNYVTNNYTSKFSNDDIADIKAINVTSVTPLPEGDFTAKTLIVQKGEEDVHVDYLLAENNGKCAVHDIKVEGVSLLTSQRSEFAALAGASGVQAVIDAMKKKLAN